VARKKTPDLSSGFGFDDLSALVEEPIRAPEPRPDRKRPSLTTARCACGGSIEADAENPADIIRAVDDHRSSVQHVEWLFLGGLGLPQDPEMFGRVPVSDPLFPQTYPQGGSGSSETLSWTKGGYDSPDGLYPQYPHHDDELISNQELRSSTVLYGRTESSRRCQFYTHRDGRVRCTNDVVATFGAVGACIRHREIYKRLKEAGLAVDTSVPLLL
jgi:hypothetical protein